jgi:hypothetical protein
MRNSVSLAFFGGENTTQKGQLHCGVMPVEQYDNNYLKDTLNS